MRRAAVAAVVAGVVSVVGAGGARAGQLQVNINPAQNVGCGLLSESGNLNTGATANLFQYIPCSSGSLVLSSYPAVPGDQTQYGSGSIGGWQVTAPAGLTITSATSSGVKVVGGGGGWTFGAYWDQASDLSWSSASSRTVYGDAPLSTSTWGFAMDCQGAGPCDNDSGVSVGSITLNAQETTAPTIIPSGGSLYDQNGWVWNPPGDAWPISVTTSDPSGVCDITAHVQDHPVQGPQANPNLGAWQQCPQESWDPSSGGSVDTRAYVTGDGTLPLFFTATNAAGNPTTTPTATIHVDNDPVSVTFANAIESDTNPDLNQWTSDPVTITPTASTGPSGVSSDSCSVDGDTPIQDSGGGPITVAGDGTHTFSCTAANRALDPQGAHNTATASETVKIDEVPPTVGFEPQSPSSPAQLVADTSDSESGVQGGVITMARVGSTTKPTPLPTGFDGSHLVAEVPDSHVHGAFLFTATSCDKVGNCGSTTEQLTLPLRLAARSEVSFTPIASGAKTVHRRITVHGRKRTVTIVVGASKRCATKRVKTGKRHWREIKVCRKASLHLDQRRRVGYGHKVKLHGLLLTSQGAPLADTPVAIQTAVDDGAQDYTTVAQVTTDKSGKWTAVLPAGPSRLVHAVYAGDATLQAAVGTASIAVPAPIKITGITPSTVPWGSTITIHGKLGGGELPASGALVALRYGYGGHQTVYGVKTHVRGDGKFSTRFTFGAGHAPLTFGFQLETLPTGDYPYAPGRSNTVEVRVGGERHAIREAVAEPAKRSS